MKIMLLEWNSFCTEDTVAALKHWGHQVYIIPYDEKKTWSVQCDEISKEREEEGIKFLFSFNYFPEISNYCKQNDLFYIAWVYDSPYLNLYSYTIINKCNCVFVFDYSLYHEFETQGIDTVHYLPLAASPERLDQYINTAAMITRHNCDIAFVGSLYTEKKHNLYKKFQGISEFYKGYLDGLIRAQLNVYGYNFIQDALTQDLIDEMERVYATNPEALTAATPEYIYAEYVLNRQVTALERTEILQTLSKRHTVYIYTHDRNASIGKALNMGEVDYYREMPYVFKNARINLNITLRSIKTGIPLRAWDIMGCGGFLLTNYQEEFLQYFEPDKEFVFYSSIEEAVDKVDFYLKNDSLRHKIAEDGYQKIIQEHTFEKRIKKMLKKVEEVFND